MKITELLRESINPEVLVPGFRHQQEIGDLILTAATDNAGKTLVISAYNKDKVRVGVVHFYLKFGDSMESAVTSVHPEYRKQGVASTMYAYARMLGNTIEPSKHQLPGGKAMWKAWKKSGDAQHLMKEDDQNPFLASKVKVPVYHGTSEKFNKFNRPDHGVFFTPHKEWAADHYGDNVLVCYINVPKLYTLNYGRDFDEKVMDAFFDRDYETLTKYIQKMKSKGYSAMQAPGDSEMICVFDNAQIMNAQTGKEM